MVLPALVAPAASAVGGLLSKYGAKILATGLFNKASKYIQEHGGPIGAAKAAYSSVSKGVDTVKNTYNKAKDLYSKVKDGASLIPDGKVKNFIYKAFGKVDKLKERSDDMVGRVEGGIQKIGGKIDQFDARFGNRTAAQARLP